MNDTINQGVRPQSNGASAHRWSGPKETGWTPYVEMARWRLRFYTGTVIYALVLLVICLSGSVR
jgi:hypothetical protein